MIFWRHSSRSRLVRPTALIFVATAIASAAFLQCVGDEPAVAPSVDAGTDDGSTGNDADAGTDAAPTTCAWDAPFNPPTPVAGLATDAIEGHPSLSPNELSIYFHGVGGSLSDGSTKADLYVATRTSITAPFGAPVELAISTSFQDYNPSVSHDGTTLYYDSATDDGGARTAMWIAKKPSPSQPFSSPFLLPSPPGSPQAGISADDGQPFITDDDVELWFSSRRDGGAGYDLYSSQILGGSFGVATSESTLNGATSDYDPSLSVDRLTVYLSSNRPGGSAAGYDIWRSHRSTVADAFPAPTPVADLSSPMDEFGGWLSADNCRFYFETNRAAGTSNIYLAERSP